MMVANMSTSSDSSRMQTPPSATAQQLQTSPNVSSAPSTLQPSPVDGTNSSSASPTNTTASDGSGFDLASLIAASQPTLKQEQQDQMPSQIFAMPDAGALFQFFQQTQQNAMMQAAAQRAAAQQQQQQQQQQAERKRSYPCTFQFCVICQKDVHSSKLPCHIRQCHVAKPMFQCPSCDFTSTYSKNNVKSHMVSLHGLAGDPISYMDKYAPQVEEFMKMCFPNVRGRGRPMQGRASPRSPASPQQLAAAARRNSHATMQNSMVRRPSLAKEHELLALAQQQHQHQQQQHAALMAQAQSLNPLSIFPNLFNNNNNNNNNTNTFGAKQNTTMTIKTEASEVMDNGVVSSSASSSLDDVINNMQQQHASSRSLSMASLRTISQPVRPGENLQPRYQTLPIDWSVLSEDQTKSTVFTTLPVENVMKVDPAHLAEFRAAPSPLLSPEQAAAVARVRQQFSLQGFEILFAVHSFSRMDLNIMSVEQVESIASIAPSAVDVQRLKDYQTAHPATVLGDDEQFIVALSKIDRLEEKLAVMLHMGRFEKELTSITEKLNDLRTASKILLNCIPFKQLLQLILSLENQLVGHGEAQSIKGFIVSRMAEICAFTLPSGNSLLSILAISMRDASNDVTSVFDILPVLRIAAKTPYHEIVECLSVLEEANARAEQELKEGGANPMVTSFLERSRTPLNEVYEQALATKDELYSLMGFMAEPMPHSNQSFEPELFFQKVADFLESLKSIVEQIEV